VDTDAIISRFLRLTTTQLSDALDSLSFSGGICGLSLQNANARKMIGLAFTVKYCEVPKDRKIFYAADYIDEVPTGSVIVLDNAGRDHCTTWGGILTRLAEHKRIAGTVINGLARDLADVRATAYPLYSKGMFMQSGKGRVMKEASQVPIEMCGTVICPNDWVFGDQNGAVVIPQNLVTDALARAEKISRCEERITADVLKGTPLATVRTIHNYARPWEYDDGE
jgi:regulator of RNase E activity RraA